MRRISGSFWTLERDERLRRLEAEGLSAAKIGEKLGTTQDAVLGRLHRLSGVALTYPSYTRQANETRARNAARMKERKRITDAAISKMRHEIARGVERNPGDCEGAENRCDPQGDWGRGRSYAAAGTADSRGDIGKPPGCCRSAAITGAV
jgi:hypothetical protein